MYGYTIPMALEDFIPVILSAVGFYFLSRMIMGLDRTSGKVAFASSTLIVLGGVSKATWKLIVASSSIDIVWMNSALFICLAPGFTFFSWALWNAMQIYEGKEIPNNVWIRPFAVYVLFAIGAIAAYITNPQERYWFFILLTLTTFANLAVGVSLIRQARQLELSVVAGLFLFNIVMVFILSGLARAPQTASMQWIEQGLQTLSQAAFAFASWKLYKAISGEEVSAITTAD